MITQDVCYDLTFTWFYCKYTPLLFLKTVGMFHALYVEMCFVES